MGENIAFHNGSEVPQTSEIHRTNLLEWKNESRKERKVNKLFLTSPPKHFLATVAAFLTCCPHNVYCGSDEIPQEAMQRLLQCMSNSKSHPTSRKQLTPCLPPHHSLKCQTCGHFCFPLIQYRFLFPASWLILIIHSFSSNLPTKEFWTSTVYNVHRKCSCSYLYGFSKPEQVILEQSQWKTLHFPYLLVLFNFISPSKCFLSLIYFKFGLFSSKSRFPRTGDATSDWKILRESPAQTCPLCRIV